MAHVIVFMLDNALDCPLPSLYLPLSLRCSLTTSSLPCTHHYLPQDHLENTQFTLSSGRTCISTYHLQTYLLKALGSLLNLPQPSHRAHTHCGPTRPPYAHLPPTVKAQPCFVLLRPNQLLHPPTSPGLRNFGLMYGHWFPIESQKSCPYDSPSSPHGHP